jgi:hypothetical protein
MSGSKFASGACHKSMGRTRVHRAASMSAVKTGETSAAPGRRRAFYGRADDR